MSLILTFAFFFFGFLLLLAAELTSVMSSAESLGLLSEADGIILGLYTLLFASSLESDSAPKLSFSLLHVH
jgi:hypothetical protein